MKTLGSDVSLRTTGISNDSLNFMFRYRPENKNPEINVHSENKTLRDKHQLGTHPLVRMLL